MATAPYGVRLLVGAAVTAIEETRRLPQTVLMYPMTVASTFAHIVMKVQQDLADLAIKGDTTLDNLFPPKDEKPDWATFDEDSSEQPAPPANDNGQRRTEGRFALYSTADGEMPPTGTATKSDTAAPPVAPPVATDLGYDGLTLAQLRARMTGLSVHDLQALLAYEETGKARAPFQTLLANRITRATAK